MAELQKNSGVNLIACAIAVIVAIAAVVLAVMGNTVPAVVLAVAGVVIAAAALKMAGSGNKIVTLGFILSLSCGVFAAAFAGFSYIAYLAVQSF